MPTTTTTTAATNGSGTNGLAACPAAMTTVATHDRVAKPTSTGTAKTPNPLGSDSYCSGRVKLAVLARQSLIDEGSHRHADSA